MTPGGAALGEQSLPETEIHYLLGNQRRREAIERLRSRGETVDVRELAEEIAAAEAGERPPPARVRESVYASLRQTHLPKLDEAGVVVYDEDRKEVRARDRAAVVGNYMDVVSPIGITWGEYYRGLGVLGLCAVVASSVGIPVAAALPPLAWATAVLALVAVSTVYQMWADRAIHQLLPIG